MKTLPGWAEDSRQRLSAESFNAVGGYDVLDLRNVLPNAAQMVADIGKANEEWLEKKCAERESVAKQVDRMRGLHEYGALMSPEKGRGFSQVARRTHRQWLREAQSVSWANGLRHGLSQKAESRLLAYEPQAMDARRFCVERNKVESFSDYVLCATSHVCGLAMQRVRRNVPFIDVFCQASHAQQACLLVLVDWPRLLLRGLEVALGHAMADGQPLPVACSLYSDRPGSGLDALFDKAPEVWHVACWLACEPIPVKWQKRVTCVFVVNPHKPIGTLDFGKKTGAINRKYCVRSSDRYGTRIFEQDNGVWREAILSEIMPAEILNLYCNLGIWAPAATDSPEP